jgi:hypothetical protein
MQLVKDITFTQASEYVPVPGGTSNMVVYDGWTMETLAVTSNDATRNKHIYTVFVLPPPAGESAPQAILHRDTTSRARLRFINAGPDQGALDLHVNQNALFEDVPYGETTPYTYVASGQYTASLGSTQITHTLDLEHGQDYSLIASGDGGTPVLFLLQDDNSIPGAGLTRLRLVNAAITESLRLSVINGPLLFDDVGHNSASDYTNIAGGTHWLDLWTTGGEWQLILPDVQLRDGQVYTVIALAQSSGDVELVVFTDLATTKTVQTMYVIDEPEPGTWQAVLSGDPGPEDAYVFSAIGTSPAPQLTDVAVAHNPGDAQARLNWRLSTHEPDTRLGVYVNSGPLTYTEVITDPNSGISSTVAITNYSGPALA